MSTVYGRNVGSPPTRRREATYTVEHLAVERILAPVSDSQPRSTGHWRSGRCPLKSRIHRLQIEDGPDHQSCREEHDTASATTGHDKASRTTAASGSRLFEYSAVCADPSQRVSQRHETEHEPGEQDGDEGHRQQPQVQRRGDGAAQGVRDQRLQHVERSRGQQQSDERTRRTAAASTSS